jgi:hypothetical protein
MNTFFLQASRFADEDAYDERKFMNLLRSASSEKVTKRSITEASTPEEADKMISQEMKEIIEQEMQRLVMEPA